jgi:hypothetical protein
MNLRVLLGILLLNAQEELEVRAFSGMVTEVIHLQSGVLDAELPVEHLLQFAPPLRSRRCGSVVIAITVIVTTAIVTTLVVQVVVVQIVLVVAPVIV